jgi:hypothetical protein
VTGGEKMQFIPDELIKYSKYRWEFLRRNSKFIDDYKKTNKTLKEYKKSGIYQEDVLQTNEYKNFCQKWRLDGLMDPNTSYDNFIGSVDDGPSDEIFKDTKYKQFYYKKSHAEEFFYKTLVPSSKIDESAKVVDIFDWSKKPEIGFDIKLPGLLTMKPAVSDKLRKEGKLSIEVNLNYPKSRLMKDIKRLIDNVKELYEDEYKRLLLDGFLNEKGFKGYMDLLDSFPSGGIDILNDPTYQNLMQEFEKIYQKEYKQRQKKYKKKYHFDNFDDYLKVYDLRQEGMSWAKIKNTLKLNSVSTARNHYNAACELIEKGIDLYVK